MESVCLINFPEIPEPVRLERLSYPSPLRRLPVVIDTDASNEIDDQFAIAYSLLSPERLDVQAVYAAPYSADGEDPAGGMEASFDEICRIFAKMGMSAEDRVFRGSGAYLKSYDEPVASDAAEDLVRRAMAMADSPLYVVSIAAITNVATAILLEPEIIDRIVVVWLAGHGLHWRHTAEFNLRQDLPASRIVFDCGVPLVHIPCNGVTTHLLTTVPEIEQHVKGRGAIGDYLAQIFMDYHSDHFAWTKVIWDIAPVAWLIDPQWVPTEIVHSPVITDQLTWSVDRTRHFIRSATFIDRDPVFRDFFTKLALHAPENTSV